MIIGQESSTGRYLQYSRFSVRCQMLILYMKYWWNLEFLKVVFCEKVFQCVSMGGAQI